MADDQREDTLEITYSQIDASRELRRLRKLGLKSSKDHLVVELARSSLVILPAVLFVFGVVTQSQLIAFYIGYFAHRWFQKYAKDRLLAWAGPAEFRRASSQDGTARLSKDGLRLIGAKSDILLRWPSVAITQVANDFILRIAPEQSVPVLEKWLPEGWTADRVRDCLREWS